MKPPYSRDFVAFARRCLRDIVGEDQLKGAYVEYLLASLKSLCAGEPCRLIINLPPRHLKTVIAGVLVAAYEIGKRPSSKLLVISGSDRLGDATRNQLATILQASWYQECFSTRLRTANADGFSTSAGGQIIFAPVDGKFTGLGANLVIVDDLAEIDDADNPDRLSEINEIFLTKIMSRLSDRAEGRIVVIAHRLSELDLSGLLLDSDTGWSHICLSLVANADEMRVAADGTTFERKAGELLRPGYVSAAELAQMRKLRNFESLYQQNPGGRAFERLEQSCFQIFHGELESTTPVVVSVDPARSIRDRSAFSVIQVWAVLGHRYALIEQYREKLDYRALGALLVRVCKEYLPSTLLIEDNSNAAGLKDRVRNVCRNVILVDVRNQTKMERFSRHVSSLRSGCIEIGTKVDFEMFVDEVTRFPSGKFSDQVDALSLFLNYVTSNDIPLRQTRALAELGSALRCNTGTASEIAILCEDNVAMVQVKPRRMKEC